MDENNCTCILVCLLISFIILINRDCLLPKYLFQLLVESIIYLSSTPRRCKYKPLVSYWIIFANRWTGKLISLLLVVALSKVVPQWLDFPAALLRGFREAEVLHPLRNFGVNVSVVDETPQCPLNVFLAPDVDKCQGLLVWPWAWCWFFNWHADVSIWQKKHSTRHCLHWFWYECTISQETVVSFDLSILLHVQWCSIFQSSWA